MCPGRRQVFLPFSCAALLFGTFAFSAQDKPASSKDLKIGFLMDSLKVERWQTDLDNFQKRAGELGAQVLVETAEGDDELQLQQAQKLLSAGVKALVLVSHDAEKAVRIVTAAKTKNVPLLCYERMVPSLLRMTARREGRLRPCPSTTSRARFSSPDRMRTLPPSSAFLKARKP